MGTNIIERVYNNERIGKALVADGLITEEGLEEALEVQKQEGGFVGKILVEKEMLYEEELVSYFTERYSVPYVQPATFPINPDAKKFIPEEIARKYLVLPVDNMGNRLSVICAGPLEGAVLGHALEACQGTPVSYFVSTVSEIEEAIEKIYNN